MPTEKIHRTTRGTYVKRDAKGNEVQGGVVEQTEAAVVSWYPGQNVQIAVDGGVPFWFDDENLNERDEQPHTSLWMTLDRHEINRLIKALRRARDAAYGRDE